jgi:hypothetical protein
MNAQLYYFGGSGGFFALWHILLGTDYSCELQKGMNSYNIIRRSDWPAISELPATIFDLPDGVQEELTNNQEWKLIVEQTIENNNVSPRSINSSFYRSQWDINEDRTKWKSTEKWPSNLLTQNSSFSNKLFFNCNPGQEDIIQDCDKKILLYTDIETQMMLAKNKHAWIYAEKSIEEFELVKTPQTKKFNGFEVFDKVAEFAEYTDYQIRLQDVVNTQGQALLDIFDLTINENNVHHNNMWLNLHTDEEKGRLLNES